MRKTFETFIKTMQDGNHQEGINSYCYGQFKKELIDGMALITLLDEAPSMFHNYKGASKLEFVPNYSDVALVVTELNNKFITYLALMKNFISDDTLSDVGIDTMSDMNELLDE